MNLSNLVNRCKLGLENWKHWLWHNNAYWYAGPNSFENPTRSRRDIQENSKLPFLVTFLAYNLHDSSENRRSWSRWKLVYSPEDTRRRSISVALPNPSPIKRYEQKTVALCTLHEYWWKQGALLRYPAQFCEYRSEILLSYLKLCKETETLPPFFSIF